MTTATYFKTIMDIDVTYGWDKGIYFVFYHDHQVDGLTDDQYYKFLDKVSDLGKVS